MALGHIPIRSGLEGASESLGPLSFSHLKPKHGIPKEPSLVIPNQK